jgi:hypothetical protein
MSLVSNAAATTSAAAAAVGEVAEADTQAAGCDEAISEEAAHTHARAQLAQAVTVLLAGLGEDPTREGLRETPQVSPQCHSHDRRVHVDSDECSAGAQPAALAARVQQENIRSMFSLLHVTNAAPQWRAPYCRAQQDAVLQGQSTRATWQLTRRAAAVRRGWQRRCSTRRVGIACRRQRNWDRRCLQRRRWHWGTPLSS